MQKPSLPSGTRDFAPQVLKRRQAIMRVLEQVFLSHGFDPIETPALENLKTLQGKYGDEGDQLLFRILNSGDFMGKAPEELRSDSKALSSHISDRGLRYDLTVPLARFVVMNRGQLTFPFKRYQMQPVWRADRPQKGRYREFWQCDIDIVGADSVLCEAELVEMYLESFAKLGLGVQVRINHRGLLDALLPALGSKSAWNEFMISIDKADKIGRDGVSQDLINREMGHAVPVWEWLCEAQDLDSFEAKLEAFEDRKIYEVEDANAQSVEQGKTACEKAIHDLKLLKSLLPDQASVVLDLTLARGLSYYTGAVFEVSADDARLPADFRLGSIGGGGRYDNLTGAFGLADVPGVGVSFGLDRIYDTMEAAGLFAEDSQAIAGVLLCPMDEESFALATQASRDLRAAGIPSEVYTSAAKLKKQLDYANNRGYALVGIIGDQERAEQCIMLKNLQTGQQEKIGMQQLIAQVKGVLGV
ncbi:MAG: histidine--tRNA ligase [Bacteroidetes bacterium]|nr:histidine--tRNA ligase [Bacteroidota bacterium]MDA0944190.1 histidine--tRNA ligase [Bacteroidota bacterium]MDA1112620.1 histidine--tRNA ligase [Bacteroidota bacterium]